MQGCPELVSSLLEMFKEIRRTMPGIQNAHQIRASVIANWLKSNNLRQVQYMAGHKYVSSTERYQLGNLEKLQEQLEKYHPLSRI
jgi:integrase/recombinase XerD